MSSLTVEQFLDEPTDKFRSTFPSITAKQKDIQQVPDLNKLRIFDARLADNRVELLPCCRLYRCESVGLVGGVLAVHVRIQRINERNQFGGGQGGIHASRWLDRLRPFE